MWIRYLIFFILLFVAVIWKLCAYRKGGFHFQNDRTSPVKKLFLRAKGGFEEMRRKEDFGFDVALLAIIVLIGLLLLK